MEGLLELPAVGGEEEVDDFVADSLLASEIVVDGLTNECITIRKFKSLGRDPLGGEVLEKLVGLGGLSGSVKSFKGDQ